MPNEYYNASGVPQTGAFGSSAQMRAEFGRLVEAFNKLPPLIGHTGQLVRIGATGLESFVPDYLAAAASAASTLYLPLTGGTLTGPLTTYGMANFGALSVAGSFGAAVSGPLAFDARNGLNGVMLNNSTDAFTVESNKTVGSYNIAWKSFSDFPGAPALVLSGYGGMRLFTANTEALRVDVTGLATFAGETRSPKVTASIGAGRLDMQAGFGPYTGYLQFWSSNGVRQGYIGASTTTGASDAGTIPFGMGAAQFSGSVSATGFTGAGSGLTGLATGLSVGGNAATTSQRTFSDAITALAFNGSGSGLTGVAPGLSIGGNAATTSQRTFDTLNASDLLVAYGRQTTGMATATANLGGIQLVSNGVGAAFMAFHRPGSWAAYFGLDTDNQFAVGGWSMGAARYPLLHAGNFTSYSPSLTGAGAVGTWNINITGTAGGGVGSGTVGLAAKASTLAQGGANGTAMTFAFTGNGGQPTYLWGTNDGITSMVWNPANFSVNYAASSGTAGSAVNAQTVPWTGITGQPTALSQFTNNLVLSSTQVSNALGFTPYNASNPAGYITTISSALISGALGYTPYSSGNPAGYIAGINNAQVVAALGFTPYSATNPAGFITAASLSGYALLNSAPTFSGLVRGGGGGLGLGRITVSSTLNDTSGMVAGDLRLIY